MTIAVAPARPVEAPRRNELRSAARRGVRAFGVATAWSRPFPSALVIGAKRSGTTSLWRALEAHPAVLPLFPSAKVLPLRANQKGVHYYDRSFTLGSRWYRSHFPTAMTLAVCRHRNGVALACEASPGYLAHPQAAARVARDVPEAKLVLMLRHPVQRAYSHWKEQVRNGQEQLGFAAAVAAEPERLATASTEGDDLGWALERFGYLAQSRYDAGIARWLECFPRDQLLVVFAEHYFAQPHATMDRIADFLGIGRRAEYSVREENAAIAADLDPTIARSLWVELEASVRTTERMLGEPSPWKASVR